MIEVGDPVRSSRIYENLSFLRWLALALGLLVVLHHKLLEGFIRQSGSPNRELLIELAYGVMLSLTAWLVLTRLRRSVGQTKKAERALAQTHIELSQSNKRLEFLLQLHCRLSKTQYDTSLIDTIADLFMEVSPAIHDGLAQTLGCLKLRTVQIDNWLMHGQNQQSVIGLDEVQRLLLKETAAEVSNG